MDGSTSARSPLIANPTPYVRPTFYPERGRTVAGVAPSVDASAACYRYLQSPAMPHNTGCTYPHMGSIYPNAIPAPSTSPFRVPVSGMSNLRQFWPPTPPPDGFGRLGMTTSLYPMYPAIAPLAPSSDSGIHGLIPRLGSSPSHYPHFFDTHKESSFLSPGLNIASPLTPTSSLASSTPLSSLPPSFDRPQPFPPMSLAVKSMDLCKQQYCHENDDTQRVETYTDSVCHHPITDQRRPGSANIEANSKYEKIKGNATYHSYQESHAHNTKSKNDSKLLKNNDRIEKKHCNRSEEECSVIAGNNNFKSPDFQENLSETNACKVKKSKNLQCSEYIDIVNISDIPRSYEEISKSQTTDSCSEKLRHNNCCLYPTSTTAIVTSSPLTTSTSVTYSHQQLHTPARIYSPISDLQLKKEIEENRHDCQFAKSTYGKTWHDRSNMELCHCQRESGHKSRHIVHTGACRVPKIPKTESSQSSCCAQRLGNRQECLPLMYQPAIYESNNHSSQINNKCAHTSLPQNDIEQLSPTWSFLHSSQNHLQLDTISKPTSIPEQSGSNKEYKLPYPSEFLPDIQPLNYALTKSQQHDSKTVVQNSLHGGKERTISTSSADTHLSTPDKKTSTATTSSSVITCSTANSNIPVGIAIAQQRHSMSSAWKLGKLTDPHFPAAHNGSDGFPSLPNTSACHKNDNILRDQPYLSVKPIPTLPSNHAGLLVSPAKQWEPDTIPRTVLPHTWLRHGRVVAPGMWIGQGNYASATPTASLPIGPLDSAQVSMPPVGYQLVRDSLTGHILLIPAVNIELIDGTQLWPKLDTSAALHRQSTPQMQRPRYYPMPPEGGYREIEVETSLFGAQESYRQEDKLEHRDTTHSAKVLDAENHQNEKKLIIADSKNDEIQTVDSSSPKVSAEIPVTNHVLEHSSLYAEKHPSALLKDNEHHPTVSLAQAPVAVQTEHAKRSQATSPLISVPITLHQPNKQNINQENIINDKVNQNYTSIIPSNLHDDSYHHKTSAVQVNLEKEANAYNIEQEKCKTIHSSKGKTDEKCLKENETIEQKTCPSQKTVSVDKTEILKRKEPPPTAPNERQSTANFIDHRGLNLLVDSIEELNCENLASKNKNLTENSKSSIECNMSLMTADVQRPQNISDKVCKIREPEYSFFSSLNTSSTDSLGILCALAEQRFIEETKSASSDLKHSVLSNSRDLCDSSIKVNENDCSKEQINNDKVALVSPSDNSKQYIFPECPNVEMSSEIESKEEEMRKRLAELQQKYKQKQKELARLQPRKSKKNNISSQRCPGRPRTVQPYMYYRIRKEKLVSKSSSPNLVTSSSDDHTTETKRNKSIVNRNCVKSMQQGKKHKLEDLHSTTKNQKRSKECNIQLIDNTTFSKHYRKHNNLIDVKSDSPSSKKRMRKNLHSKRKICKEEITQEDTDVIPIHKYPETNYSKALQLNISTSGLQNCREPETSNNFRNQKESISSKEVFLKDVSKVNLCNDHCRKHTDTEEPQSKQNLGIGNDNNENSAGYEGDTSDIEMPQAKRRKIAKPKKYLLPKYRESNEDTAVKQTINSSSTKDDDLYATKSQMGTETKNLKLSHCAVKQSEMISKAKKKMRLKRSLEVSPKKIKNREYRKREKEEDISMTDELFAALKKCRLSETNVIGTSSVSNGKEQLESSYSEGENLPLIALIDKSITEAKSCILSLENLQDKTRVLIMDEGLFYAGFITAIQAPDVYGITLDGERGNKPHIYSREEILSAGILEVKPTHLRELPEGRRMCAFWSQQYRCLYAGTIAKATNPGTVLDKSSVFVEFDDGDSGSISIDDIRFLPQNYADNDPISNSRLSGKQQRCSNEAEQAVISEASIKNNINIGIKGRTNKMICSNKGNIAEESCTEQKNQIFPLQNSSEENEVTDAATMLPNKKKHSIKGNTSKKLKKSLNEMKHSSSKKECKRKRIDKCSENVSSKLKRHKKRKDDRKRNHHHNHRHHHRHHHHHHHKKHKHEKLKAQPMDQNLLFSSDANNLKDTLKMSSTMSEDGTHPSSSETEKDSTVKVLSDLNKLARKKEQNKSSDDITQFLSNIKVTSDSIVDIRDSNATEPDSEPQLWSWYGKSFRRPGSKRKARKEYYRAIIRGKDILKVGDCAVFVSSGRPHLPYIGQIETMWQSWGGSMVVKVKWFYHPEEMKQGIGLSLAKGALFQSTHVDENDVQTISHKCELLTEQEYKRKMDLRRNTQYKMDDEDIYYLAGSYDPISGTVMPEIGYA